ncbi:MAG: translation initiation factor Sui1 [Marinobacterium sp.]|nr:translation initiation factor Sui1 [Marinobacterium sp.]
MAKSLSEQLGGLVFSTEHGRLCPECQQPLDDCICDQLAEQQRIAALDGVVRIRRETAGRKGKGVTTIHGIARTDAELKPLLKQLKKVCGTGGSLKDGVLEIQGDHRERLKEALEKQGFNVRLAGG